MDFKIGFILGKKIVLEKLDKWVVSDCLEDKIIYWKILQKF